MTVEKRKHRSDNGAGHDGRPRALLGLLATIAATISLAALLWRLTGPPEVPSGLPDWQHTRDVLTGSRVATGDAVSMAATIGWLVLAYLGVTVTLRIVSEVAARLTDRARWARAMLRLSDMITLPPVRRTVDAALAGTLVAAAWLRSGPSMAAAESSLVATLVVAEPQELGTDGRYQSGLDRVNGHVTPTASSDDAPYTVAEGDSLWRIAEQFYGDGSLYAAIFDANAGRIMVTGEAFTDPSLIRPGWTLDIPPPADGESPVTPNTMYEVKEGDSLWRIAESVLGSGLRWTEIWELNKDRDMAGITPFADPSRIFPGWVLELPGPTELTEVPTIEPIATPTAAPAPSAATSTAGPAEPTGVAASPIPTAPEPDTPAPVNGTPPESDSGGGGTPELPTPLGGTVLAAAAGVGAAAATALVVRQWRRRSDGSGIATMRRRHSTGDAVRVDLAARSLSSALRDLGFEDARMLLVRETERVLKFTLDCAPGDADALAHSRYEVARRLACAVDAAVASRTRVEFTLSRFQRLAGLLLDRATTQSAVLLLPVGATEAGIHYLSLSGARSILLIGNEAATGHMLGSWLSSLKALHPTDALRFVEGGRVDGMTKCEQIAGADEARSTPELARELEDAIVAQQSSSAPHAEPPTISCAFLSEDAIEELHHLETAIHRGPEHGIYTICVAPQPVEIGNMFGARIAFESGDAEPDDLVLTLGRDVPIVLKPVEVHAQPLRRHFDPLADPVDEHVRFALVDDVERVDSDFKLAEEPDENVVGSPEEISPPSEQPALPEEVPLISEPRAPDAAVSQGSRQATLLVAEPEETDESASAQHPTFEVRCFGTFEVLVNGQEITGWTIQKARELLAYLIARGGARVSREEAADALWPEEPADQVEHLLSNAAYYVRRTLKTATPSRNGRVLTISEQKYQLLSGVFYVDLDAFDAHVRRAESFEGSEALIEYDRALAIYKGDFMGSEPFEWAEPYRRDYQRRFVTAAHQAGRLALECRDVKRAIGFYQAILDRDPIDEEAARALVRCHAKLGDTNSVRRVYKLLREALKRELDDTKAEPLPETTVLVQELTR